MLMGIQHKNMTKSHARLTKNNGFWFIIFMDNVTNWLPTAFFGHAVKIENLLQIWLKNVGNKLDTSFWKGDELNSST